MSSRSPEHEDPDDLFAHTRMSLGDHIEELRTALFKAMKGFVVALIIGFCLAQPATQFIARPIEVALTHFYNARLERKMRETDEQTRYTLTDQSLEAVRAAGAPEEVLAKLEALRNMPVRRVEIEQILETVPDKDTRANYQDLMLEHAQKSTGMNNLPQKLSLEIPRNELANALNMPNRFPPEEKVTLNFWVPASELTRIVYGQIRELIRPPTLSALSVTEAFMVWLKVAIYIGLVLASPWIFYQLWMFVAAGLYPTEKRLVHFYLPISLGLFLVGVLLCEFVVLPIGIHYLLSFNQWMNIEPDLRLSEWLTFAIMMPLVFGIAFQLPLVMFFLDRLGIMTVETYLAYWRISVFVILVLSGFLAVSPDPFSMLAMAIPMWGLYFLGIWLCKMSPRPEPDLEVPDPEEMVEV